MRNAFEASYICIICIWQTLIVCSYSTLAALHNLEHICRTWRIGCAGGEACIVLQTQHPGSLPDGPGKVLPGAARGWGRAFLNGGQNGEWGGQEQWRPPLLYPSSVLALHLASWICTSCIAGVARSLKGQAGTLFGARRKIPLPQVDLQPSALDTVQAMKPGCARAGYVGLSV